MVRSVKMSKNQVVMVTAFVAVALVVAMTIFMPGIWVSETQAIRALEAHGLSRIEILDKDIFWLRYRGCSASDDAKFDARGVNVQGKTVDVMVCVSWPFKGAVVRVK